MTETHEAAVSAAEMARILGVVPETVKRRATTGTPDRHQIPGFKTNGDAGHWRFYPSVVKAHLSAPAEPEWNTSSQSRGRRRRAA